MDGLIHNPLTYIDSTLFPLVYAGFAIAVIAAAWRMISARDGTGPQELPPVPAAFDPYDIAWLRGGKHAVIRTVIYALHQRGLVEVIPPGWFRDSQLVAKDGAGGATLTALEARVLDAVLSPVRPAALFRGALPSDVGRLYERLQARLESERLCRSADDKSLATMIMLIAALFLVGLPLYWFQVEGSAMQPPPSFGFLLLLTFPALTILWGVGPVAMAHLTARGLAHVSRIQTAYRGASMPTVAMVGLFGIRALRTTSDASFAGLFRKCRSSSPAWLHGWDEAASDGCSGECGSNDD
jgi:uncharacterized protein (TIGR04222 family)